MRLKELGGLSKLADEDKAARSFEQLVRDVHEFQQECRDTANRIADVTKNDELRFVSAPSPARKNERNTTRAKGGSQCAMRIDAAPLRMFLSRALSPAEARCKRTDSAPHLV